MRYLLIGDPHIKNDVIGFSDLETLTLQIQSLVSEKNIDYVIIMGDLFDTHEVVNLKVLQAWQRALVSISKRSSSSSNNKKVYIIPGNHDAGHNYNPNREYYTVPRYATIDTEVECVNEVKILTHDDHRIGVIPFCRDKNVFINAVSALVNSGVKYILCHQEFNGSQYENGFYSSEGVDPSVVPDGIKIISGHIHSPQSLGESIVYTGASRWLTTNDANQDRSHLILDTETGAIETVSSACSKIVSLIVNESNLEEFNSKVKALSDNSRLSVIVIGTDKTIQELLHKVKLFTSSLLECKIRTKVINHNIDNKIKESEGVNQGLLTYLSMIKADEEVVSEIRKRVKV